MRERLRFPVAGGFALALLLAPTAAWSQGYEGSYSIAELKGDLGSEDSALSLAAVLKLLTISDDGTSLRIVREALDSGADRVRTSVIKAFDIRADSRANDLIVTELSNPNAAVRDAAVSALRRMPSEKVVDALSKTLEDARRGTQARVAAAKTLQTIRQKEAIGALVKGLSARDPQVAEASASALEEMTTYDFGEDAAAWQQWWAQGMHKSREELLEEFLQNLRAKLEESNQRAASLEEDLTATTLALLDRRENRDNPASLVAAMKSRLAGVRLYGSRELGRVRSGEEQAVELLQAALEDEDAAVRKESANSLAKLGEKARAASAALIARLGDEDPGVRAAAAVTLGILGDWRAGSMLQISLKVDPSPDVRARAAISLGLLSDPNALDALAEALHDSAASVRSEAAIALGQIGDPEAIGFLVQSHSDPNELVRRSVAQSLGKMGRGDRRALETVRALAGDPKAIVRQAVCFALGNLADPASIAELVPLARDPEPSVSEAAWQSLALLAADSFDRWNGLVDQFVSTGDLEGASRALVLLIERFDGRAELAEAVNLSKRKLAGLYIRLGQATEAARLYAELDQSPHADATLKLSLAQAYAMSGNPGKAVEAYLEGLRIPGGDTPDAWQGMIQALSSLVDSGAHEEAAKYIASIENDFPASTGKLRESLTALKARIKPELTSSESR